MVLPGARCIGGGYHTPRPRDDRSDGLGGPGLSAGPRLHRAPWGPLHQGYHTPHARDDRSEAPEESWPFHRDKDALSSLMPDASEKGHAARLRRSIGSPERSWPFLHRLCSIVLPGARCIRDRTRHTPQTILREILAYPGLSRLPRCPAK